MRTTTLLRAALTLAVALLLATACSGGTSAAPATPSATAGDQHAADIAYAQMMMPHVVQGVELTEMVPGRAANPSLAQLVFGMNYVDVEEQGQLAGQLHLWNAPVPGENGVPMTSMPGMADAATLARLRTMSGPAFDQAWLAVMIAHHQGGVDMSRDYLAHGSGQALATTAETQVQVGSRQIDEMKALQRPV